jgi:uncharacterized protein YggT (Ycf19 family)
MEFVILVLQGVSYLIIGDAVLSWFAPRDRFPRSLTSKLTEPLYRPIHALVDPQKTGGIDLAPIILLVALQLVRNGLARSMF